MATSNVSADLFEVKGKVALVTGAVSGIGLAITKCLLENGAKVSMLDINGTEGEKVLASLHGQYSADVVSFTRVDVTVPKQLADSFQKTNEMFGGLDIVCNNAGLLDDEQNWRKLIEVNVCAVIEGTTLAIEHMSTTKGGKGGVVINTASIAGIMPFSVVYSKYTASKHAVVGYTRVHEVTAKAHGVRVNCICPGVVDTPPMKEMLNREPPIFDPEVTEYSKTHLLSADKVAEGVLQLISDTSKAGAVMAIPSDWGFTFPKLLNRNDIFPENIVALMQEKETAD